MDAFEQDPTAALAHVCLTTGIHVPGLNNLRRLSNGTCPEEGEQVAIDEAEKTLEALTASVSRAASHAADAYVKCCHPTEKLLSCASCGIKARAYIASPSRRKARATGSKARPGPVLLFF